MRHYDDPYSRGYSIAPQWGRPHPMDPNWADGEYHGQRMQSNDRQGAYGWYRQAHEHDLRSHGGFDGIYDEGPGRFDREGIYHHPMYGGQVQHPRSQGMRAGGSAPRRMEIRGGYDAGFRRVENGGVHGDNRFLGQYNRHSVGLRYGSEYDRSYGRAPGNQGEGRYMPRGTREPTHERGFNGYNQGGFAPGNGLDPRSR